MLSQSLLDKEYGPVEVVLLQYQIHVQASQSQHVRDSKEPLLSPSRVGRAAPALMKTLLPMRVAGVLKVLMGAGEVARVLWVSLLPLPLWAWVPRLVLWY
jgi:hypothetical protein